MGALACNSRSSSMAFVAFLVIVVLMSVVVEPVIEREAEIQSVCRTFSHSYAMQ